MDGEEKARNVLEDIGLTRTEVEIFLDLVKNAPSTAQDVSKRVRVYRSNAYEALRRLIARGFAFEVKEENRTLFNASEPNFIKEYLKKKEADVDEIIEYVKNITRNPEKEESVSVFKGVATLRNMWFGLLNLRQPILTYNVPSEIIDLVGEGFLEEFHKERVKSKVDSKLIFMKKTERLEKLNKFSHTEARYLTEDHESCASTAICGDIVHIYIYEEPLTVIEIRNQKVAEAYKRQFEILWGIAKNGK